MAIPLTDELQRSRQDAKPSSPWVQIQTGHEDGDYSSRTPARQAEYQGRPSIPKNEWLGRLTRSTLAIALVLITAPVSAPAITFPRQATEPPPRLMIVFKALLNASHRSGLSVGLLFNIAYAESSFRPDCVTWRNGVITARGLMQINPRYQDFLVRKYMPWLNPANFDWSDAEQNALLGALYLADLIKRHGEWGGVCSYSCGEGRFLELVKYGRRLPKETEDYYRRVLWI